MKQYLPPIDTEKMELLFEIKNNYQAGRLTIQQAQQQIIKKIGKVSAYHIAYIEQTMTQETDDECINENAHSLLQLLAGHLDNVLPQLPSNHPIMHYLKENEKMKELLLSVEDLVQYPMIKNQWLELYEQLNKYLIHYKRKQNQLYPILERKGFTRPSTTMWTFDDLVKDEIKKSWELLNNNKEEDFISEQSKVVDLTRDLIEKEELILFPTSLALISEEEFMQMQEGDQEIGFAYITVEPTTSQVIHNNSTNTEFASELQALLNKHGYNIGKNTLLDVTNGKLTLEQINLIYQHLPFDISFVDENELVQFYSDTTHRIFPRSKNVIGREVMNCHPRKSAHIVREVIDKLKSGEEEHAEFWISKPNSFIYIMYIAVRDKDGRFRGVIEIMQDCTHIRSLEGSQTLLTWSNKKKKPNTLQHEESNNLKTINEITPNTRLKDLLNQYPTLRQNLSKIAPEFKMLNSPLGKIMAMRATIKMMSQHSGINVDKLIEEIKKNI